MNAEAILKKHFTKRAKELKQPLDFDLIKKLPAYPAIISAMEDYAEQKRPPKMRP